jgi:L-cystine uptake protein TcyP (sodium:dicarboxylate symporter family)
VVKSLLFCRDYCHICLCGVLTVQLFRLDASGLITTVAKTDKVPTDIPTSILNIIPSNVFAALTTNNALPIVFIAALLGFAFLAIRKENEVLGNRLINGVSTANEIVMTLTDIVIQLTPYGVLALITCYRYQ